MITNQISQITAVRRRMALDHMNFRAFQMLIFCSCLAISSSAAGSGSKGFPVALMTLCSKRSTTSVASAIRPRLMR
ncbi:hypothetical protein D9M72_611220 [compost metagenome]